MYPLVMKGKKDFNKTICKLENSLYKIFSHKYEIINGLKVF